MVSRDWTSQELATMKAHAKEGAEVIAGLTGRTVSSVKAAAIRHRVSLRKRRERRGKVMGESRKGSLTADGLGHIRADVLTGSLSGQRLTDHLGAVAAEMRGERVALCPQCAKNPIERQDTGLCRTCHNRAVLEAYQRADTERNAIREVATARQQRHRAQPTDKDDVHE